MKLPRNVSGAALQASLRRLGYDTDRRGDACVAPVTRRRRPTRLPHFDYTRQGAYFVTICTRSRACLFGEVVDGEMQLNDVGEVAHAMWEEVDPDYWTVR